jgi:hypothetical protein
VLERENTRLISLLEGLRSTPRSGAECERCHRAETQMDNMCREYAGQHELMQGLLVRLRDLESENFALMESKPTCDFSQ